MTVERRMLGFSQDDEGHWVAHLDCLHRQHIRHDPPMRFAEWVLDDEQRKARVGELLDCPLCDRAELPPDLDSLRISDSWTEVSIPRALRRDHRVATGTWGVLRVEEGSLRFAAATSPAIDRELGVGDDQAIPPNVLHSVEVVGAVRFHVEFLGRAGG